jgi:hypothetical protein
MTRADDVKGGSRLSWVALFVFVLLVVLAGGGCQAIVSDEVPAFTCTGTNPLACPAGMYCNGAGCVRCEKEDVCDGRDNDCNGLIDDGEISDRDGDSFTFCGRFSPETGKLVDLDCDDDDPDIFPGAEEKCNGIDDDCDGIPDNPDKACKVGEVCAPRGGGCIPEAQACTPQNCPPPKVCDKSTQQCINPTANLPLGAECGSDQECSSGVCATAGMLAGAIPGPKGVCSKPCCTSAQCPLAFVCYAPGTGGRYCLNSEVAGRVKTPGLADPGASCTKGDTCRSGLCDKGKCLDTCCSDGDCKNGTACTFVEVGGKAFFGCAPAPGSGGGTATCAGNSDCKTNLCAFYANSTTCVAPCCSSSADCGSVGPTKIACVNSARQALTKNTIVAICIGTSAGNKSFGDTCSADNECTTHLCDAVTARCSSVCCLDSDCPGNTPCRPAPSGILRCVP